MSAYAGAPPRRDRANPTRSRPPSIAAGQAAWKDCARDERAVRERSRSLRRELPCGSRGTRRPSRGSERARERSRSWNRAYRSDEARSAPRRQPTGGARSPQHPRVRRTSGSGRSHPRGATTPPPAAKKRSGRAETRWPGRREDATPSPPRPRAWRPRGARQRRVRRPLENQPRAAPGSSQLSAAAFASRTGGREILARREPDTAPGRAFGR